MAFDKNQFQDLIERTLKEFDLYSPEAVQLLLGTAAQESEFGTYLRQIGGGPGMGAFQIERDTHRWLQVTNAKKYPALLKWNYEDLEFNLKASIIYCRLRYYVDPHSIPSTLGDQALYWKRVYNTMYGAGTADQYIKNYHKYVS